MRLTFQNLFCVLLAFTWSGAASFGQSEASSSQQSPPQTQSQTQTSAQDKQDTVAEAARKAKEKKAAAAKRKVLTEDDLSGKTGGVSVVGTENTKLSGTVAPYREAEDAPNGEKYWRGRAQPIRKEMADVDQAIAQLKEDIKKYGPGGIDITTGMKQNVAYVEDRNAQIQELQKKKAKLQKSLDDLEEEGRKAGALPAWFR